MAIEIKDGNIIYNDMQLIIPYSQITESGYKLVKIEDDPKPDPKPIPTVLTARGMAIELSGKPNFLVGLSANRKAMVEQGIKPNIFYAYLTEGWRTWNENDDYIDIVINHAIANNAIPMFTYYDMAKKVEYRKDTSDSDKQKYLSDLEAMFERIARFDMPVLVHLEPDLFGYLQKRKIDPTKTLSEDFKYILEMGRRIAPKCKIGFHASQWGDWFDWTDYYAEVRKHAFSVADYVFQFGKPDFVTLEMSDRDAGYYESIGKKDMYWDETNKVLPNFDKYFEWADAVIYRMGVPGLLWQIPLGLPSTVSGSPEHYRDNKVEYLFTNPDEVIDAGFFGMVFGSGATGQTTIETDKFQFQNAMAKYNFKPREIYESVVEDVDLGSDRKLQIHCIGDSITESTGWRTTLYNELKKANIQTDFIGTVTDPYPKSTEKEHDGHGGWTTHAIIKNIDSWFDKILKPEITILMIGTNDIAHWMAEPVTAIPSRVGIILDKIKANAPYSTILLCSIPPQSSKFIEIVKHDRQLLVKEYNIYLKVVASSYKKQKVHFVDVYGALTLDDLRDGIHPNAEGNRKIGELLAAKIKGLIA